MPNRIIKETICTSEEIEQLTHEEECFFYRLMVNVDDFGRMDAREAIIKSKCYPLKSIDIKCLQMLIRRLQEVGLIQVYEVDSRRYLRLISWEKHQQIRAKKSKYPGPKNGVDITCNQLISSEIICHRNPIQSNPIEIQYNHLATIDENQEKTIATAKAVAVSKSKKTDGRELLNTIPDLNAQVADDYMTARKTKKAGALTRTALAMIEKQAALANITTAQAIAFSAGKGWVGFMAAWYEKEISGDAGKTNAERTQDYKDAQAARFYEPLLTMTEEEKVQWGFDV